jgi:hypothetical protein
MRRLFPAILAVGSSTVLFALFAFGMKPIFMGDPFIMRFVRTAEMEVIVVHHPKHAAPARFIFTSQGDPLDQTILGKNSLRELPFGKLVFIDATYKPGLVRLTHHGIDLYIASAGIYANLEKPGADSGKRPENKHEWGKVVELDFRKPVNDAANRTTPDEKDKSMAPTASP